VTSAGLLAAGMVLSIPSAVADYNVRWVQLAAASTQPVTLCGQLSDRALNGRVPLHRQALSAGRQTTS
jgi:hypothetical protein